MAALSRSASSLGLVLGPINKNMVLEIFYGLWKNPIIFNWNTWFSSSSLLSKSGYLNCFTIFRWWIEVVNPSQG